VVVDLVAPDIGGDASARVLFGKWAAEGTEPAAPGLLWLETSNALLLTWSMSPSRSGLAPS
jgi:hypothetical protein